ncbi:hypothetical protein GCM10027406_00140 [Leifsonia lichenia]
MFGFSFEKLIVIAVIAIALVGPARLPAYASKLAALVTALRRMADGARDRMREELGPDFDDVDWKKLDPRQYNPRQIIRQALQDDAPSGDTRPDEAPSGDAAPGDAPSGDAPPEDRAIDGVPSSDDRRDTAPATAGETERRTRS